MDRLLSNTYFFSEQGMPYVPVASYYNPDSYEESHYFFPAGSSASEVGVEEVPLPVKRKIPFV
jgi:hypothetical protein